jgi:sugar phosphate isomerase/epimerase
MNAPNDLALGIVSDEIAADFPTALRHGMQWSITRYELRCLVSGRVPRVESREIDAVVALVKQEGVRITALSPGMFKAHLADSATIEDELRTVLPATLDLAARLDSRLIIVFGFQREAGEPAASFQRAVGYMRRAAELAHKAGIRIAIENEPGFWCDTGKNTHALITTVGHPSLGANWDPCNAYGTDETPYPAGYEALKDVIINVHAKDTTKGSLIQCVPIGTGALDWKGQVQALLRDRIVKHITIETHCYPLIENSRHNAETLRSYMQSPLP